MTRTNWFKHQTIAINYFWFFD